MSEKVMLRFVLLGSYNTFESLWDDFIHNKIAVMTPDGRYGSFKNKPDWDYWRGVLVNIWNRSRAGQVEN